MVSISAAAARRVAIHCQGLGGNWSFPAGKEGIARAIDRLGYVQIDTISVVERAHHHVLWSRRPDYDPGMLHELLAEDRRIFEWWRRDVASYIPMEDYAFYLPHMHAHAQRTRTRQWLEENAELVDRVLDRIRAEGPLGSADFEAPAGFQRGTWWSWKPAKRALETLFATGELMVTQRRNFQRIYDLRERVLPPGLELREPDPDATARFHLRRDLAGLGIACVQELRRGSRDKSLATLQDLIDAGQVVPVQIEGLDDKDCYVWAQALQDVERDAPDGSLLHILSPFDNLVIHRPRLERLFDFVYRLEAYMPAAQRQYGYFVLPILWRERFVARADCKADRPSQTLYVRRLIFEPAFQPDDGLLPALAARFWDFATFNGCEQVVVEEVDPAPFADELARALAERA
jgi:uncharacterized protein YcaQ